MKIKNSVGLGGLLAMATLVTALFTNVNTVSADGGAQAAAAKLKPLKTVGDIEALVPGDVVMMACPVCKDVTETRITPPLKGSGPATETKVAVAVHSCPGCGAKWETVGQGQAKTYKVTHVCSHCGSKEAFCTVKKTKAPAKEEENK